MTTNTSYQTDFERQIEFDFLRATELAALNYVGQASRLSNTEQTEGEA